MLVVGVRLNIPDAPLRRGLASPFVGGLLHVRRLARVGRGPQHEHATLLVLHAALDAADERLAAYEVLRITQDGWCCCQRGGEGACSAATDVLVKLEDSYPSCDHGSKRSHTCHPTFGPTAIGRAAEMPHCVHSAHTVERTVERTAHGPSEHLWSD